MGKRHEYPSSEEDQEDKIQRRIHRLEKRLDRQKEKRRKISSYRASSDRSSSRRSRSRSSRGYSRRRYTRRSLSRHSRHRSPRISRARKSRRRSPNRSSSKDSRRRSSGRGKSQSCTRSRNSARRSRSRTRSQDSMHCAQRRSRSRYTARRLSTRGPSRQNSSSRSPSQGSRKSSPRQSSSVREIPPVLTEGNNDILTENNSRNDDAIVQSAALAEVQVQDDNLQTTSAVIASAVDNPVVAVPEHEVELQQDVLEVIGARLEPDEKCSAAVHKDVALRWAEILRNGLPVEEVKKLVEKYPPPENCTFISVPKLNAEIIAAIQETAIKRDKRIVEKQERLAACLAALGKAISISLKIEGSKRIELLESLSEGGRLLASVHREESLARKSLVLANLNSSLKTTLSNMTVDEWLFGGDLENKIKSAKTLERTSKDLKPPAKSQQSRVTKNWKGPTRRSTFKSRPVTSGAYRRQSSNASDPKKPSFRKDTQRYRRR